MASLRASFEKELKQKLQQKATQFQSEESVLLKAFKYFDLTQNGLVDRNQFIKVIEKLGLPIFNPQDYFELFTYYDSENTGKMDYKMFIGTMFNNTTSITRQKSPEKSYKKTSTQYYRGHTQQDSVLKLQRFLQSKGAHGILTLATIFATSDSQQNRQIDIQIFVEAAKKLGSNQTQQELQEIFSYFDKNQNGQVNYDELLQGLRGPLSGFRRELIHKAFEGLDANNQSFITLEHLKTSYNGRIHPDVRVGKKNEREVISDFLRNLDSFILYMNIQDGQISGNEFEEFFAFVSSSIENDTYFELLVKSTLPLAQNYQQSGQYQQFAQYSPYNQNAQQQQSPYQKESQQQFDAISNRSAISSLSNQNPNQIDSDNRSQQSQQNKQPDFDQVSQRSYASQRSQQSQRSQVSQQRSQVSQQKSQVSQQRSQVSQQRSQQSQQRLQQQANPLQQRAFDIMFQIRQKLATRGCRGFIGIQRQFRIMDDDYDMKISFQEFKKALRDYKINLSDSDFELVFDFIDSDNSGKLDIDELVRGIRGPMNKQRTELVSRVFQKLDVDQDGIITINDIKGIYSVRYHPDIKNGTKTEDEVLGEFLETFELHHNLKRGTRDQRVTLDEFIEYYNNVSTNIDNEEFFRQMIVNAYRLENQNTSYEAFSASPQKNYVKQDERDYRSQLIQNAPFGTSKAPVDYSTNLRPTSAFVQKTSAIQQGDVYTQNPSRQQGQLQEVPAGQPSWQGFQWRPQSAQSQNKEQVSVEQLLVNLRQKLKARGTRGIISLGKFFRMADKDNSRYLDLNEFIDVLNNLRLNQTKEQIFQLFAYFDRDQNGQINYDEFLRYIRGQMNQFRRDITMRAFQKFDRDGSGFIDVNDLKGVYHAQNHPDVRNGKKTEEEVLSEFLDTFEIHHALVVHDQKGRDAVVTWEEFAEYYENLSASIDDDRYYEQVIKNTWKLDEAPVQQEQQQQRPYF